MKRFKLYWLNGKTEIVSGRNVTDAFTRSGYDTNDIRALGHYEPLSMGGDCDEYFVGDNIGMID